MSAAQHNIYERHFEEKFIEKRKSVDIMNILVVLIYIYEIVAVRVSQTMRDQA